MALLREINLRLVRDRKGVELTCTSYALSGCFRRLEVVAAIHRFLPDVREIVGKLCKGIELYVPKNSKPVDISVYVCRRIAEVRLPKGAAAKTRFNYSVYPGTSNVYLSIDAFGRVNRGWELIANGHRFATAPLKPVEVTGAVSFTESDPKSEEWRFKTGKGFEVIVGCSSLALMKERRKVNFHPVMVPHPSSCRGLGGQRC